jgi:SAM-dependent methyltransferase
MKADPPLPEYSRRHLAKVQAHYETDIGSTRAALCYRDMLAHYYNLLIPPSAAVLEVGCGPGDLLKRLRTKNRTGIDLSERQIRLAKDKIPKGNFYVQAGEDLCLPTQSFDYIVISETINFAADVQRLLAKLQPVSHEGTRLIVNLHSALWRPAIWAATMVGLRNRHPESSWLSKNDVTALLRLSGWEPIRYEPRILWPIELFGVEKFLNRFIAPILSPLCLSLFTIARLAPKGRQPEKTVSIVIPARNEAGNIQSAVERTPEMGVWTELIFVEGNSKDNTWDEIQRVKQAYPQKRIKVLQQSGKGKGNAVREGFAVAEGELLMILDADLTMPPEELPKFYEAVVSGRCEFANGSRLVYPMDGKAMRFLNLCFNKIFSILFSWLLGQKVKDTLCGTKALTKQSYDSVVANRSHFGEFDPFGDFDLLFGASKLNLKILDIPIRYRERAYGETNIRRWRHGLLLLQMVAFAAVKLKFV